LFFFNLFLLSLRAFNLVRMYRVYLGNLDEQVTEPVLEKVFADHSLPVTSILIKRGYGFVDCPDQTTFDQTIDRLNGAFATMKKSVNNDFSFVILLLSLY